MFEKLKAIFSTGTAAVADSVGKALDSLFTSKEELGKINIDLEKVKATVIEAVNKHIEMMGEQANALTTVEINAQVAEMSNVRNMQIEALKQQDLFSKRFVYYLASAVVFLTFCFDACLFFVHYPPENRDIIMNLTGLLNGTALIMVLGYFFGSSIGSKQKQEQIDAMKK